MQFESHTRRFKLRTSPLSFLRQHWWVPIVTVVLLVAFGLLGYALLKKSQQLEKLSNTQTSSQNEQFIVEIRKHLQVPEEEPTVATVSDASKLNSQEFFKHVQDGDKVLIFPKANRALIYRPSTQKVIEYAKVNLDGLNQPSL